MSDGWNHGDSPFHAGEQQVQERLGLRDAMETFARRVVRDHMPNQHREFYGMLPFVLLGTVDDRGRPWASLVAGRPGFMTTPDARTLDVAARPLAGDPLNGTLRPGADVGPQGHVAGLDVLRAVAEGLHHVDGEVVGPHPLDAAGDAVAPPAT